jgi:hypothetical protein
MERSVRLRGAATAAGLWLPLAVVLGRSADPRGVALAIAGLVASPVIGWVLAFQARRSTGLGFRTAGLFAVAAVAVGACLWGLTFAVIDGRDAADAFGFAAVGLIFMGIPLVIMGTLLALAWIPLVKRSTDAL